MKTVGDFLSDWFTQPAGLFLYHAVILICLMIALQWHWLNKEQADGRRQWTSRLLLGLLGLQVLQLLAALGVILYRLDPLSILPVMDRFVQLSSLLWLIVLFIPRLAESRAGLIVAVLVQAAAAGWAVHNMLNWRAAFPVSPFNGTPVEIIWTVAGLVLSLLGVAAHLLLAQRNGAVIAVVLAALSIGYALQLLQPDVRLHYALPVRVAFLLAMPMLPSLLASLQRDALDLDNTPEATAIKSLPAPPTQASEAEAAWKGYIDSTEQLLRELSTRAEALLVRVDDRADLKTLSALETRTHELDQLLAGNRTLHERLTQAAGAEAAVGEAALPEIHPDMRTALATCLRRYHHLPDLQPAAYGWLDDAIAELEGGSQPNTTLDRIIDMALARNQPAIEEQNLVIKIFGETSKPVSGLYKAYLEAVISVLLDSAVRLSAPAQTVLIRVEHLTEQLSTSFTFNDADDGLEIGRLSMLAEPPRAQLWMQRDPAATTVTLRLETGDDG